jgi:hypothetical protein
MKWVKRMIVNWARDDRDQPDICVSPKGRLNTRDGINSDPTLQFKVYSAIGGKIVEFSRYDRKSDRHDHQVYIINQDQDFGERIAKIATMENLKS